MKVIFKILLPVSLVLNIYFFYNYYRSLQVRKVIDGMNEIKYTNITEGNAYLVNRIIREQPQLTKKKYYFINIWNIACGPCIKEMPVLDSLADVVSRKDIGYVFLTENSDKLIKGFLKRKNITSRNFTFINDGNDYVNSLLKARGVKDKGYPLQVIINKKGEINYFDGLLITSPRDSTLTSVINALPL